MRVKAGIMKYQTEKGTQAIPPFDVLWDGGYLGSKGSKEDYMGSYSMAVLAMLRM